MSARAKVERGLDQLAARYRPQRAVLVDEAPTGAGWVHELKLDGYRAGGAVANGKARVISRQGGDLTGDFPELARALAALDVTAALVDGEIVVLDAQGRTSFQRLQNRRRSREGLAYFLFDLLWLDGKDTTSWPLERRKQRLRALLDGAPPLLRYSDHLDVDGPAMHRRACELGAEGIVSKRRDAPYRAGLRSAEWRKSKCELRQEFVVGGFTDPSDPRRSLGSLLIGHRDGARLIWAGKVSRGEGFDARGRPALRRRLDALEQEACPFSPRPSGWLGRHAHWVRPELVIEVKFTEWTDAGQARHPTVLGIRTDKPAREVVRERATASAAVVAGVELRDPDQIIFPELGVTRLDLARYYEAVADWALPHLARRPMTLVRCRGRLTHADALRSQCQFLRHVAASYTGIDAPRIQIAEQKKIGEYVYVDGLPSLVGLLNGGIVELHVWNATIDDLEHPDRVVFDLDPSDDAPWSHVIDGARLLRRALDRIGLASWPKTAGGKGLHVEVPLARDRSWDDVFAFSRELAERIARDDPRFTSVFAKEHRAGKVLIDYKRNYRTSIAIAAFSPRARPHGPVAVPVSWREVTPRLRPDQWTVATLPRRLARLTRDPWEEPGP